MFASVVFFFVFVANSLGEDLIATTENGQVKGISLQTIDNKTPFYAFRGIPYAEPPLGENRFEAPKPVQNWGGVLDATKDTPECLQNSPVVGSEDCLHINVYTPKRPEANCASPLPVFVWIYGGGFEYGDSKYETYGPDYIVEKDIVVVSFNYRVGILGFASTGDLVVPGNNGLKDQVLALKWVKKNIRNFCGDPNQVTLAGQSAGSASVSYHLQSKMSEGLFNRAIMQSGTSLNLFALSRNIPALMQTLAEKTGVDASSSKTLIAGLKALNSTYLYETAVSVAQGALLTYNPRDGSMYGPVMEPQHDGAFFTDKSYELMKNGNFHKVPVMLGFTSLEGTFNFDLVFRLYLVQYDLDHTKLLPVDLNIDSGKKAEAAKKLKRHYFGLLPVSLSTDSLMFFLTDDQFIRPIREFARLTSAAGVPTYLYRFSYEGGLGGFAQRDVPGVMHGEDLSYYWRTQHAPARDHDLVVRSRMIAMWTNFIKFGNPTPQNQRLLQDQIWKCPATDSIHYLDIGNDLVSTSEPEQKNMAVWDELYNTYGKRPFDTY